MADDLISRQEAIEAIRASTKKYTGFMEMEMYTDDDAVEAIISLPSAQPEDICSECDAWNVYKNYAQAEIVRCKDCKYRGGLSGFYCDIVEKAVGVDSFCSWAERRTDE